MYYDVLCNTYYILILYNYHCLLPTWCLHDAYMMPTCSWNISALASPGAWWISDSPSGAAKPALHEARARGWNPSTAALMWPKLSVQPCTAQNVAGIDSEGIGIDWSHEPFIETITTYQNHHCNTVTSANWRAWKIRMCTIEARENLLLKLLLNAEIIWNHLKSAK